VWPARSHSAISPSLSRTQRHRYLVGSAGILPATLPNDLPAPGYADHSGCIPYFYGSSPVVGNVTLGAAHALLNEYADLPVPGVINGVSAATAELAPLYTVFNPSVCS
jgi:hypothetical protein